MLFSVVKKLCVLFSVRYFLSYKNHLKLCSSIKSSEGSSFQVLRNLPGVFEIPSVVKQQMSQSVGRYETFLPIVCPYLSI